MVNIISNLDLSFLFDLSKTYKDQKKTINRKLIPAIKAAMNPSLQVYDVEILKVVRQLYKSRREIWKKRNDGQFQIHQKRQHVTSRREQVFIYYYFIV